VENVERERKYHTNDTRSRIRVLDLSPKTILEFRRNDISELDEAVVYSDAERVIFRSFSVEVVADFFVVELDFDFSGDVDDVFFFVDLVFSDFSPFFLETTFFFFFSFGFTDSF
jgi:hypothetical protein